MKHWFSLLFHPLCTCWIFFLLNHNDVPFILCISTSLNFYIFNLMYIILNRKNIDIGRESVSLKPEKNLYTLSFDLEEVV